MSKSAVSYVGHYRKEIFDYISSKGGEELFYIRSLSGDKVTDLVFTLEQGDLNLFSNGHYFTSPSDLLVYLNVNGFGKTDPEGSNTEGGNAANAVIGHYNILDNIISHETGESLSEIIEKIKVGTTELDSFIRKVEQIRADRKSAKKAAERSIEIDNRPMLEVWRDQNYLPSKGIIFKEFVAKYGKEMIWHDLQCLTVNEFELKYGLK